MSFMVNLTVNSFLYAIGNLFCVERVNAPLFIQIDENQNNF